MSPGTRQTRMRSATRRLRGAATAASPVLCALAILIGCVAPAAASLKWSIGSFEFPASASQISVAGTASMVPAGAGRASLLLNATDSSGAVWWKAPIDATDGFDTVFTVSGTHTVGGRGPGEGFALVVRSGGLAGGTGGPGIGYERLRNAVAVEFDTAPEAGPDYTFKPGTLQQVGLYFPHVSVHVPDADGRLSRWESHVTGSGAIAAAEIPQLFDGANGLHAVRVRYERGQALEVYLDGGLRVRVPSFDLKSYLDPKSVNVGFTAATGGNTETRHSIFSWKLRDDPGPDTYSERFTFKTSNQSVWGPGQGAARWSKEFSQTWAEEFTLPDKTVDVPALGEFGAGAHLKTAGKVGLKFDAAANGGVVNVSYPLFLNMTLPPQKTLAPGDHFRVSVRFKTDPLATLRTTSPDASFKTALLFGAEKPIGADRFLDFGFFARAFDEDLFNVNERLPMAPQQFTFLDTDKLRSSGLLDAAGFFETQDDEGATGQKKGSHRGERGKGTTKGTKGGKSPLSFISGSFRRPALDANGILGTQFDEPGGLTGSAEDRFFNLHSDFTSALLELAGLDPIARAINFDESVDLGELGSFSAGLHIADLYGDMDLGLKVDYGFAPRPRLELVIRDGLQSPRSVFVDLPPNGDPLDVPLDLVMPANGDPVSITPVLELKNNFTNSPTILLDGGATFDAFSLYFDAPGIGGLDTGDKIVPSKSLMGATSFSIDPVGFELGGFQKLTGRTAVVLPRDSASPLISDIDPESVAAGSPAADVTLAGEEFTALSSVIWSDGALRYLVPAAVLSPGAIRATMPAELLRTAVSGTFTVFNQQKAGDALAYLQGALNPPARQFSNPVRFEVVNGVPLLSSVAPGSALVQPQGADLVLTLRGASFALPTTNADGSLKDAGATVQWSDGGDWRNLTTFVDSAVQLRAVLPAGYLAEARTAMLRVKNGEPGGGDSNAVPFVLNNPTPVLTSLSETAFSPASRQTSVSLIVEGGGFVPTSQVVWDGKAFPTEFVSANRLSAEIDLASLTAGPHQVSVASPQPGGGASASLPFMVDATAPTTQLALSGPQGQGGWFRGGVTATLTAADNFSGVGKTAYRLDDGELAEYTGPLTLSGEGSHKLVYWSLDGLGNQETPQTAAVQIDLTPPVTTASDPQITGGTARLTLTATDALSGIAKTLYQVNGGSVQTYATGITLSGGATFEVRYWSEDTAGNTETAHSLTVRVNTDTAPPVTTAQLKGKKGLNGWFRDSVLVALSATDDHAGVDKTFYRLDRGAQKTYSAPFSVCGDGVHSVRFWSVDKAGNIEEAQTLEIRIDGAAPKVTAKASPDRIWPPNGKKVPVTITGTVNDAVSGVAFGSAGYSILDCGRGKGARGVLTLKPDGSFSFTLGLEARRSGRERDGHTYRVVIAAMDRAGNPGGATVTILVPHDKGDRDDGRRGK